MTEKLLNKAKQRWGEKKQVNSPLTLLFEDTTGFETQM